VGNSVVGGGLACLKCALKLCSLPEYNIFRSFIYIVLIYCSSHFLVKDFMQKMSQQSSCMSLEYEDVPIKTSTTYSTCSTVTSIATVERGENSKGTTLYTICMMSLLLLDLYTFITYIEIIISMGII
jgi:hypothetical protein